MSPRRTPADIGVYGLGKLGSALAKNLGRSGFRVAIFNIDPKATKAFKNENYPGEFVDTYSVEEFVEQMTLPRVILLCVSTGPATTSVITQLQDVITPGDVLVDCSNSKFQDTRRRERELQQAGIHFLGCGIGGGKMAAEAGASMMVGGSEEGYELAGPYLEAIAAKSETGQPCCARFGPGGAGHFLKMVHNGIEQTQMQLLAEAFTLLQVVGVPTVECGKYVSQWAQGFGGSYLVEAAKHLISEKDFASGKPFLDVVRDVMFVSTTDREVAATSLDLGSPTTAAGATAQAQLLSTRVGQRRKVRSLYHGGQKETAVPTVIGDNAEVESVATAIGDALRAASAVALSQAFDLIGQASDEYGWNLDRHRVTQVWRDGTVIRSGLLDITSKAYAMDSRLPCLLADLDFVNLVKAALPQWRQVVAKATLAGVPVPALSAALTYFESLRADRLPAAFVQAQRDYLWGACYQRTDREGRFHRTWNEEQVREVEVKI